MIAGVTTDVFEAAARARDARTDRALRQAVDHFVRAMSFVPDAAPGALSTEDVRKIRATAESVIGLIEARVERIPLASAQRLVSAVYEIQRLLEELDRWQRHFLKQVNS